MFVYDKDMERVMQAKKREILCEMEQTKERILRELSGVDKMTMTRLRQVLDDYNKIEYMITTKINAIEQRVINFTGAYGGNLEEVRTEIADLANEALTIAKGKNRARVFTTTEEMNAFISSADSVGQLQVGDNLYIVALDVPDWWVSEVHTTPNSEGKYYNVAQLETQKVDLTPINNSISELSAKTTINSVSLSDGKVILYKENKRVTVRMPNFPEVATFSIPSEYLPSGTIQIPGNYYSSDWKYYPARVQIDANGTITIRYFTALGGSSTTATDGYIEFGASWYTN